MNTQITNIIAEQILDSRGNPTLLVTVSCGDVHGSFAVPSGASTGAHEAHELRDADGHGVQNAINVCNSIIAPVLIGHDALDQAGIDATLLQLDGTTNKDKLGSNNTIGVSVACAKLGAAISGMQTYEYLQKLADIKPTQKIPHIYMNLVNGGKHAKNGLAFQEYHVVSVDSSVADAVNMGLAVQRSLENIIKSDTGVTELVLGDEGGFAPPVTDIRKPLVYLQRAIDENGYVGKLRLALDVAASSFYSNGVYVIDGKDYSTADMVQLYAELIAEFNLLSIEDPFNEEDFASFAQLKQQHPGTIVMGDDLTVTNKQLVQHAIDNNSINAMIIKPNQIGTLTETLATMQLASNNDIKLIVSHRSGETNDDFIADLCYAFSCFGLKSGSPIKPERMAKYNRLINITL